MPGTVDGGIKARDENKKRHGEDFYSRIAKQAWSDPERVKQRKQGGFASNRALAREAGAKGGRMSRRKPAREKA